MAEEELDGFDNLDNLFGEEGGGDDAAAAAGGDLDDLLGDTGGDEGGGGGGEASDSELDSFFEDLSTIDDLEVAQEEAPPAAPPAADDEAEPMAAAAAAAAPAAAAAAAPARKPKKEKKPRAPAQKMGFFKRTLFLLIPLAVIAGVTYWLFFTPSEEVPWEVTEEEPFIEQPVEEERMALPPREPPPPPPAPEPVAATPAPAPAPARPAQPSVTYGIQVATCFFDSCVAAFRERLDDRGIPARVTSRNLSRETLEIYSETSFASRETAEGLADRINREHRMEGQAYARAEGRAFVISMGTFTDLSRANIVKDTLNQRMQGEAIFTTRIRQIPYTLKNVVGGRYASREAAEAARRNLTSTDPRFADAFVIRN